MLDDDAPEAVGARPRKLPWDADASPALAHGLGLVCLFVAVAGVAALVMSWDGGLLDYMLVVQVAVALRVAVYFLRLASRGRRGGG